MNYTELKTAISDWEHRSYDAGKVDTFIDLFESRASRNLRTFEMETLEIVVPTSATQALPTGFIGFKNVQVNLSYIKTLEYASAQKLALAGLTSGHPQYYTINGNLVEFSPSASGLNVEWTYYKAIPALSDSALTNWLINKYPDYYLMGCIQQALIYTIDDRAGQLDQVVGRMEIDINKNGSKHMAGPITVTRG